jgi:uncharacterized protein (TIGR01244 family)
MENESELPTHAVDDNLSITAQLRPEDMERVARAGFRSVINNRPDFEGGPTQPLGADLERAARAAGLEYRHLPVPPAGHTASQAREMTQLVEQLPRPVVAFCRSGRRSAALYVMGRNTPAES